MRTPPMIKPCPDPGCKHTPQVYRHSPKGFMRREMYRVECNCEWNGPPRFTKEGAITVWNRRGGGDEPA